MGTTEGPSMEIHLRQLVHIYRSNSIGVNRKLLWRNIVRKFNIDNVEV